MADYHSKTNYQNQVIREKDQNWFKEMRFIILLTLIIGGAVMFYVWQQVEMIKYAYKIEEMIKEKKALQKINRTLRLERSYLSRLERIEEIAKKRLHMIEPEEGQVIIIGEKAEIKDAIKKFGENKLSSRKDVKGDEE